MIEPKGMVHFSISVSDLDASKRFYTEILGLRLVANVPAAGMVFLAAGNDHLVLCKSETPIQPNGTDARRVHHAFRVDSDKYEETKAFLVAKGVQIVDEENRKTGVFTGRQIYFYDLDRNVLEFSEWVPDEATDQ